MIRYRRYGNFRFWDYGVSWIGIGILLLFSAVSLILDLSFAFAIIPIAYVVVWLWCILAPQNEHFSINGDLITVYKGKNAYNIAIPKEIIVVISYADICPPFAVRTAVREQTHILKGKYAVTVLRTMPLDDTINALHRNHLQKYTMSTIQQSFGGNTLVYSFVCNQELLNQLLFNRSCSLVIPSSLAGSVTVDQNITYIDTAC